MLFAFGFNGDDFSDGETLIKSSNTSNPKQVVEGQEGASVEPKLHSLGDILKSLIGVRLTFDNYQTPNEKIVYRRQLFDVKHQVMTEEDGDANEVHSILMGNSSEEVDVRKNVYEGGFKLWECSYDLVDKLDALYENGETQKFDCLLELGCGTALPTCYLMMKLFSSNASNPSHFIFSDFNYEVLRLVTVPNILIHYAATLDPEVLHDLSDSQIPLGNDELLLTPAFLEKFTFDLKERNMDILFVSGSWGSEFVDLVAPFLPDMIITSETIYSPDSLPLISDMMVQLFEKSQPYIGLVAAKQYYFGVGGSVKEFLEDLNSKKPDTMTVETTNNDLGQLKRDIVTLRPKNR